MTPSDLDRLFRQLRETAPETPAGLASGVLSRLGPPTAQVKTVLYAGAASCLVAVALAALIGASVRDAPVETVPPELTLLTRGAGPLASL